MMPVMNPEVNGPYVQSLARGLATIRAFGAGRPTMTLSGIAAATGLSRATARRFLLTFEHLGYVRQTGREFALTPKVLELGFSYLSGLEFDQAAEPHLEQLARSLGESAWATVLDGTDIVYVLCIPAFRPMRIVVTIGTRLPAYATSMGRLFLGQLEEEELKQLLEGVEREALTSNTLTDVELIAKEVRQAREQGWAMNDQELEIGHRALSAPVRRGGRIVGAISISSGVDTFASREETLARYLEPLLATAGAISRDLEHLPRMNVEERI